MTSITLYHDEKAQDCKEQASFDNQDIVVLLLSHGLKPLEIKVLLPGRLSFSFDSALSNPIMERMMSNQDISVDYRALLRAQAAWQSALVSMKARQREW